jgi:hypothetical protein
MKKQKVKSPLARAKKLFQAKKWREVIRILEPEIFKYRESVLFYKILGISCIYANDFGGGTSYLTRAVQLDGEDVDSLLGLAVVSLKKMKTDEAIKQWLNVLEIEPGNREANRGLELIRKKLDPEKLSDFVESDRVQSVYPRVRSNFIPFVIGVIVLLCAVGSVPLFLRLVQTPITTNSVRPEIEQYVLPSNMKILTETKGDARYLLSDAEVKKSFDLAKTNFLSYRDNLALVEINRILNSNALPSIKNIVQNLKEHTTKPDFSTIRDSFSLSKVFIDPFLYVDCYVKWKGRIGSLSMTKKEISFFLWVGSEKEFEGVVPVRIDFPFELQNGQVFEVLGRIKIEKGKIILLGTALHRILNNN